MKRTLPIAAAAALLLASLAPRASADVINLLSTTLGGLPFNRPTETGDLSAVGTATPFQVIQFTISLGGSYTLSLAASDPTTFDTFAVLYATSFNPASPQANFLFANDDANLSTTNSSLTGNLVAGTTYFLVVTGFSNSDFGGYTATLSGPGTITASVVPEPGVNAILLGLSLGGVAWLKIRRRAIA